MMHCVREDTIVWLLYYTNVKILIYGSWQLKKSVVSDILSNDEKADLKKWHSGSKFKVKAEAKCTVCVCARTSAIRLEEKKWMPTKVHLTES